MKHSSCNIKKCGSWCCKYIVVEYPYICNPDTLFFFSLRHIILKEGKLFVPCRCKWLNNHGRCSFYTSRPIECRVFKCKGLKVPDEILKTDGKKEDLETETTSAYCVARRTVAFREKRKGKNTNR
jgi:hypothetical protein